MLLDWPKLPLWVKLPSLTFCPEASSPLFSELPLPFWVPPEVSPESSPPFGGSCGVIVGPCSGVLGEGDCTVPFDSVTLSTPWITILLGTLDHNSIRSPTLYLYPSNFFNTVLKLSVPLIFNVFCNTPPCVYTFNLLRRQQI